MVRVLQTEKWQDVESCSQNREVRVENFRDPSLMSMPRYGNEYGGKLMR
jgi:hypothetical protein